MHEVCVCLKCVCVCVCVCVCSHNSARPAVRARACSKKEFAETFERCCCEKDPAEFVEGIMYTAESGVVMTGNFAESVPSGGVKNDIGLWYKPWFCACGGGGGGALCVYVFVCARCA